MIAFANFTGSIKVSKWVPKSHKVVNVLKNRFIVPLLFRIPA